MDYSNSQISSPYLAIEDTVTSEGDALGFPVIALGLLITSYFYVLPLGRFSIAGNATDIRIYDFAFLAFMFLVGLLERPKLSQRWGDKQGFLYWGAVLLIIVWLSLSLTLALGGVNSLLIGMIRAFRFTAYLLAAGFALNLVDNPRRYRFILSVIYLNIAVQACLSFAQGLGWLPGFWPAYWGANANAFPVGTLSWHHKQTGVVMLMGIALSLTFLRRPYGLFVRPVVITLMGLMISVTVFTASRTGLGGVAVLLLAYLFIHRLGGAGVIIVGALGLLAIFWLARDLVVPTAQENLNLAFFDVVERQGVEGIFTDRLIIYEDYPNAIRRDPWILLTGTGFQNVSHYLGVAAHNNYAQAWFELGIIGFIVYMRFLYGVLRSLWQAGSKIRPALEQTVAQDVWALFVGVLATMMFGETLWAQYSMFTLTGQIMTLVALAVSPMYWQPATEEQAGEADDIGNSYDPLRSW